MAVVVDRVVPAMALVAQVTVPVVLAQVVPIMAAQVGVDHAQVLVHNLRARRHHAHNRHVLTQVIRHQLTTLSSFVVNLMATMECKSATSIHTAFVKSVCTTNTLTIRASKVAHTAGDKIAFGFLMVAAQLSKSFAINS